MDLQNHILDIYTGSLASYTYSIAIL